MGARMKTLRSNKREAALRRLPPLTQANAGVPFVNWPIVYEFEESIGGSTMRHEPSPDLFGTIARRVD